MFSRVVLLGCWWLARGIVEVDRKASLLDELVKLLVLEKIEENHFRGQSQDLGWGTVFGGQVLGQASTAAAAWWRRARQEGLIRRRAER